MKYDTALPFIGNVKFETSSWEDKGNSWISEPGFTLIELLVVISIIGLLFSFSIAAYSTFYKNQGYIDSVNNLVNMLQVAHSRAVSQYAPSQYCGAGSPNLQYYQVVVSSTTPATLSMKIMCGSMASPLLIETIVTSNATFDVTPTVQFAAGTGEVPSQVTMHVSGNGTKQVQVDTSGRVTVQ